MFSFAAIDLPLHERYGCRGELFPAVVGEHLPSPAPLQPTISADQQRFPPGVLRVPKGKSRKSGYDRHLCAKRQHRGIFSGMTSSHAASTAVGATTWMNRL